LQSFYPRSEYFVPAFTNPAPTPIASVADLGAAIRARRQEAGLTLAIAAPTCGVSVKFLQALETGKATVQFDKALSVARLFGIQLVIA
jgi:HTH-type transcriptional regulator / antitoxin HipB